MGLQQDLAVEESLVMSCIRTKDCHLPKPGQTPSPEPAGSVRSQWLFQGLLWLSEAAGGPHSGLGYARRLVPLLVGKPMAARAVAVGCSQEGFLQRQSLGFGHRLPLPTFNPLFRSLLSLAWDESFIPCGFLLDRPSLPGSDVNVLTRPQ